MDGDIIDQIKTNPEWKLVCYLAAIEDESRII